MRPSLLLAACALVPQLVPLPAKKKGSGSRALEVGVGSPHHHHCGGLDKSTFPSWT